MFYDYITADWSHHSTHMYDGISRYVGEAYMARNNRWPPGPEDCL